MNKHPHKNLASECARIYLLDPQREGESGSQFRERVARTLYDRGEVVAANEALWNLVTEGDNYAYLYPLDRGCGDKFITEIAQMAEEQLHAQPSFKEKVSEFISRLGHGVESRG